MESQNQEFMKGVFESLMRKGKVRGGTEKWITFRRFNVESSGERDL